MPLPAVESNFRETIAGVCLSSKSQKSDASKDRISELSEDYEDSDQSSEESFESCKSSQSVQSCYETEMAQCKGQHEHEVMVMVDGTQEAKLLLSFPVGGTQELLALDPLSSILLVDGMRVKEAMGVRPGTLGWMVLQQCVKCLNEGVASLERPVCPLLVWFGEEPHVREEVGLVRAVGQRCVVQLEVPPAARFHKLVLFHGEAVAGRAGAVELGNSVAVWAWHRKLGKHGHDKIYEGAAMIECERQDSWNNDTKLAECSVRQKAEEDDMIRKDFKQIRNLVLKKLMSISSFV